LTRVPRKTLCGSGRLVAIVSGELRPPSMYGWRHHDCQDHLHRSDCYKLITVPKYSFY